MSTELQNFHELVSSDDLAYEITLGFFGDDDICLRYGIRHADLSDIKASPIFMVKCQDAAKQISDAGDDFKVQAQKYAMNGLHQLNEIARDTIHCAETVGDGEVRVPVPLGQRMRADELIARYAGYDKKVNALDAGGMKLVLQTNLGLGPLTPQDTYTITAEPVPADPAVEDLI